MDDGGHEVAYETCVLGRLRPGYRNLRLRDRLGSRIEHCHLFVRISFGRERNEWYSPTELRAREMQQVREISQLRRQLGLLRTSRRHHSDDDLVDFGMSCSSEEQATRNSEIGLLSMEQESERGQAEEQVEGHAAAPKCSEPLSGDVAACGARPIVPANGAACGNSFEPLEAELHI